MVKYFSMGKVRLEDLARALDIPLEVARRLGRNALWSQIGARAGHPTTRCDGDCRMSGQYVGDLERDFGNRIKN